MLRNESEVALRIFLQKFEGQNQNLFGAESLVEGFDEMVEFQESCQLLLFLHRDNLLEM